MKKAITVLLSVLMAAGVCGCGKKETAETTEPAEAVVETETEKEEAATQEEDAIDDPSWEALESLGMVETENGLFFVSITLPAELVGEEMTQEKIDAEAGTTYTSGKLNDDGSVTYKMTKAQHKAMLDQLAESMETALKNLTESGDYAISEITHNADFTSFDVRLTTEDVGMSEGFLAMGLYMYGGMYGIFTGKNADITVNYYSVNGDLIYTANSAEAGN